jgi:hypothetical protein
MRFGSFLYGTNTPDSDTDFKGVFMPTRDQILLGRIPKTLRTQAGNEHGKNSATDIDEEFFSLHYFIHLACEGETVALDMLHAERSHCMSEPDEIWLQLTAQKHLFYTKNLRALVGYARRQAAKYGIRGSRLDDAQRVLEYLKAQDEKSPGIRMEDVWDELPTGEHIHKQPRTFPETVSVVQVCGKQLQSSAKAGHYVETLTRFCDAYGDRARLAKENQGIDWKAISHAFRAGYQVRGILTNGGFTYPLPETQYLIDVKKGKLDYITDVAPALDTLMDELEGLSSNSTLPEQPDRAYWDRWLIRVVDERVFKVIDWRD